MRADYLRGQVLERSRCSAVLASYFGGLVVVDLSNRTLPRLARVLSLSSETWMVQVQDDLAYVANHAKGLVVVHIADRSAPREIRALKLDGNSQDIHIQGDIA